MRDAFNRRHHRSGHLFQNRYKSIVVEAEPYLLELVRYLHLNPLRAQVVPDLRHLDRYPWTGHSALSGTVARPWQDTRTILGQFGRPLPRARRAYRGFVAAGLPPGRRPDLQGGGRTPAISRARAGIAYLWVVRFGQPGRPLAPVLGLHPAVVYQAAQRGATQAREWERLLGKIHKTT